jgi:hypothetical protein
MKIDFEITPNCQFLAKVILVFLIPTFVWAGRMKDLFYEHERAVSYKLWGTEEPPTGFRLQNTRFISPEPPHELALASDIRFLSAYGKGTEWVTCLTQFDQSPPQSRSYVAVAVSCQPKPLLDAKK